MTWQRALSETDLLLQSHEETKIMAKPPYSDKDSTQKKRRGGAYFPEGLSNQVRIIFPLLKDAFQKALGSNLLLLLLFYYYYYSNLLLLLFLLPPMC